jgi:outer membrane receptor for Fe3+-dicitrate
LCLFRYCTGTAAEDGAVRLPSHATTDLSIGLAIWRREHLTIRSGFSVMNVSDNRYQIAKESEETPIQYASPRIISGRIKLAF